MKSWFCASVAFCTILPAALAQQPAPLVTRAPTHTFRVCADPADLPFSNEAQAGFENKIAAIVAKDLGDSLSFVWWPNRRGFVRNTLGMRQCDVMIAAPKGYDLVIETNPYYRSTYYIVTRRDRHLHITSLDDSALKTLRVGVNLIAGEDYTNTPPAHALSARGIVSNVKGFSTFYGAGAQPGDRPGDIVNAVADGTIDVAFVWGPLAGYYAKQSSVPLDLVPLPDTDHVTGFPFAYDVSMGVRHGESAFRDTLNQVIARRQADINAVLQDYGIPILPANEGQRTNVGAMH